MVEAGRLVHVTVAELDVCPLEAEVNVADCRA
jgi:hypothetical protein